MRGSQNETIANRVERVAVMVMTDRTKFIIFPWILTKTG